MAAPAQTTPDAFDPSAPADPIALAAFVSRRGGRVVAYLDAVTTPDRALHAAGEAFAAYRQARAADPDAEPAATALLRAVRRAATANAENPYRPEGRERPARRTRACEAMPRLLVAWTEARLPEGDVARLIEHLQECPDCRAMRDAFDRAEIGYRGGESVDLDGTEVGVIATAMALATPARGPRRERSTDPAPAGAGPRRTAIPAPPSSVADHLAAPSGPAPVGRRTAIPAPPTGTPVPPARDGGRPDGPTPIPGRRTTLPAAPTARDATTPAARDATGDDAATTPTRRRPPRGGPPVDPEDPLGPEALGYAVPAKGLPRPARRPAVPRVKRRGRRRGPSSALTAASAVDAPAGTAPADAPRPISDDRQAPSGDRRDAATTAVPEEAAPALGRSGAHGSEPTADGRSSPALRISDDPASPATGRDRDAADDDRAATTPAVAAPTATSVDADDHDEDRRPLPAVGPATISGSATGGRGRVTVVGRRALQAPIVRQLGVPAVLLLAVLIAALIAAGAFAGQEGDSVEPVTRPTIPTVPSNANEIPPLR